MSFRGQILKESSNPVSSPSKKTGWWKNRSPGCFLIKIWAGFGLSSRHLTFQALHKEPKYRLLDLYFKNYLKDVVQCWQTITSSISQRIEIQKGMQWLMVYCSSTWSKGHFMLPRVASWTSDTVLQSQIYTKSETKHQACKSESRAVGFCSCVQYFPGIFFLSMFYNLKNEAGFQHPKAWAAPSPWWKFIVRVLLYEEIHKGRAAWVLLKLASKIILSNVYKAIK